MPSTVREKEYRRESVVRQGEREREVWQRGSGWSLGDKKERERESGEERKDREMREGGSK